MYSTLNYLGFLVPDGQNIRLINDRGQGHPKDLFPLGPMIASLDLEVGPNPGLDP